MTPVVSLNLWARLAAGSKLQTKVLQARKILPIKSLQEIVDADTRNANIDFQHLDQT